MSVKELYDRTSEILKAAAEAKTVFVTRGGPVAVIRGLSTEDLEDLVADPEGQNLPLGVSVPGPESEPGRT